MHNPTNKNDWDFPLPTPNLGIKLNCRVEIASHYDWWMKGDKFGVVCNITNGIALVQMDKTSKYAQFPVKDLKRI